MDEAKTTAAAGAASAGSTRPDPVDPVGKILDQHAELRDTAAHIREARDPAILSALLERLHALLEAHFSDEEARWGLLGVESESQSRGAVRLRGEHRAILAELRDLVRRIGADPGLPVSAIEGEVAAILARLQDHDAWEDALLEDASGGDLVASSPLEAVASRALEVNLRRTAVDVVIPAEQRVLLEITADRYGVHENTKTLLREINHPYVGWPHTLEDLRRRAMGDFAHFIAHERAREAVAVFCSLYAKAAERAPADLRDTAVRNHLYYLEKVARESGENLTRVLPALEESLEALSVLLATDAHLAALASPRLKRLAEGLSDAPAAAGSSAIQRCLDLLSDSLRAVYRDWLLRMDPERWWREHAHASAQATPPDGVAAISHARLAAVLADLDRAGSAPAQREAQIAHCEALRVLPDAATIERGYLDAASCFDSAEGQSWQQQVERIHWLVEVLSIEALAAVHERALNEITHAFVGVLRNADRTTLDQIVAETFAALRRSELSASPSAQSLVAKIGTEALAAGDPERALGVIDAILDWDFPGPEFEGFTDEWQVRVDRSHLRAIRAYLSMIEASPDLARPLIAALVVHLKIGGVVIADTDLFQKDVSALLNAGIGPVYHLARHVLRLFPVYFDVIGAEGDLREISSRLDEIEGRRDPLCHFVRKQCHVECNPLLIEFIEAVGHFWATGDSTRLHRFTPATLHESLDVESEEYRGLHAVFGELAGSEDVRVLFATDPPEFERRLSGIAVGRAVDREKARLLFQLRRLIARKYQLDHGDLLERLAEFHPLAGDRLGTLGSALLEERHEAALEVLLDVLEQLKEIILSEERTEAVEDIYYKRHIAAGIPSMYGRYREQKLDALGLSFRIESMAGALFERMIAERSQGYVTRSTLSVVARWMRLLIRALRIDGCKARGPATAIAMLEQALTTDGIGVDQYVNILQFLSQSVENLIRIRFLEPYDAVMSRILRRMLDRGLLPAAKGESVEATILKVSEAFLRDLIAQGFGLQQLDNLVGNTLRALLDNREKLDPPTMNLLMSYDARRTTVEIDDRESPFDGAIHLGNKGFQLKRMAEDGLPVPNGFALTTEIFRCHPAIVACEELGLEYEQDVRREVERLERKVDCRFGDPERPMLLSVRSSGAISMPGVLDTFLDVGISEGIAEGLAARSGSPWGAWDAYRRFHQCWGMAHGIARDPFDALMREVKRSAGVAKKAHLPSAKMRELALRYRDLLARRDVDIPEDPYEQLFACIDLSLRSWYTDRAQAYRSACQIADEWGTAVIVQGMVYGNLHERSGTGVVLTCDPRVSSASVNLYGDFIVQGQGEDVVSGLVETFPISEAQRGAESRGAKISLEKDFPRIFEAMERHARTLIDEHGMFHQEIEFTFESDDPSDLFVLQTRDIVLSQVSDVPAFDPGEALENARLAMGIGAGGGALSGRVAHTSDDIEKLRERFGVEPIILLRPDTVPDDIPLILRTDGMVTALGGATSHAAVAAQRLGRTCIVGCRQLEVDEPHGRSQLAGEVVETGDFISIDGRDGSIYKGSHRSTVLRRQSLALDAVGAGT